MIVRRDSAVNSATLRIVVALATVLAASACATRTFVTQTELAVDRPTVLLIQPDVTLLELSAGGAVTPKANWTNAARRHIRTTLTNTLERRGADIVVSESFAGERPADRTESQLNKLHAAVGQSVLAYQVSAATRLPTKEEFDWSLGPAVAHYRDKYDADYALFVTVRDSYSSAGRKAAIVAMALLGVGLPGGQQRAFASLVDLETGEVVWFNRVARGQGDLREKEPARETIGILLREFPTT